MNFLVNKKIISNVQFIVVGDLEFMNIYNNDKDYFHNLVRFATSSKLLSNRVYEKKQYTKYNVLFSSFA